MERNAASSLKSLLPQVFADFVRSNPGAAELSLSRDQLDRICAYWEMVKATNRNINLTRVTEDTDAALLHFADSLSPLFFSLIPEGSRICDLGSGAGFPGIPLSILRPDLTVVLVDSLEKRVRFLKECISSLSLTCTAVHARAEEYGHGPERERFDAVVSRAVARMQVLSEWTLPLCRPGGKVICYKGPALAQELSEAENAIRTLGGGEGKTIPYVLGDDADGHQLFFLAKDKKTPSPYPRKGSAKKPL